MHLLELILASYIATTVLTKGRIMLPLRKLFRRVAGSVPLIKDKFTMQSYGRTVIADDNTSKTARGFDFISCPLCTGAYVTLAVMLACGQPLSLQTWLAAWGGAFFLSSMDKI